MKHQNEGHPPALNGDTRSDWSEAFERVRACRSHTCWLAARHENIRNIRVLASPAWRGSWLKLSSAHLKREQVLKK